jgi:hypothetical protein
MSLDLNKLSNKLDEALSNETTETLTKFLNDKTMTNNKQQTVVEWLFNKLESIDKVYYRYTIIYTDAKKEAFEKAKEMYQDEIEAAIIKQCAEESTSKASSYTEGYTEGYKRAVDYMTDTLKNTIQIKKNGGNNSTTVNTTGTTFLCTEFVSDQLFYKGTLPHCMRCGKPQYQHPIITNTK